MEIPTHVAVKLLEADKSLLSIRQARDRVLARTHELTAKLTEAEAKIIELEDEHGMEVAAREAAEKREAETWAELIVLRERLKQSKREQLLDQQAARSVEVAEAVADPAKEDELRSQIGQLTWERDGLARELETERQSRRADETMSAELIEAKAKLAEFAEQMKSAEAVQKAAAASATKLASAQRARDAAVANVIKVQAQFEAFKKEAESRETAGPVEAAEAVADTTKEDELQSQIVQLTSERDGLARDLESRRADETMDAELIEAKAKLAEFAEQMKSAEAVQKAAAASATKLASAQRARDAAVANVIKVQTQFEAFKKEAELQRQQSREERTILEAQILAMRMTIGNPVNDAPPEAPAATDGAAAGEATPLAPLAPQPPPAKIAKGVLISLPPQAVKKFASGGASAAAASLSTTLDQLASDPTQIGLLEKLDFEFEEFVEWAAAEDLPALAAEASACRDVTRWLRKAPTRVAEAAPALAEGITLLKDLAGLRMGSREIADPAGAMIYAVDDDVDNCECIAMTFEKLAFQTRYTVRSDIALEQMVLSSFDLIVLDVDMPGMDGFQLHERLRGAPQHLETPILFVTALISTRGRLEKLPPGNHAFLAKPYNLTALSLKALTMILRRRVDLAV